MSLIDFFFPQQAQATHLRRLAEQQHRSQRFSAQTDRRAHEQDFRVTELEHRVLELERDLGFVALLLGSLLHAVDEKGVVSRKDVAAVLEGLDGADGSVDGKLDIDALRAWGNENED